MKSLIVTRAMINRFAALLAMFFNGATPGTGRNAA
jgi:hypothetical protein